MKNLIILASLILAMHINAFSQIDYNDYKNDTFPDGYFHFNIIIKFDKNHDMILNQSEIDSVKTISLTERDHGDTVWFNPLNDREHFSNIKGIEIFKNLKNFELCKIVTPKLDFSKNKKLTHLFLHPINNVDVLNLSENSDLEYLELLSGFKKIILPKNSNLKTIIVYNSDSIVNLNNQKNLKSLTIKNCKFNKLNISNLINIEEINLSNNSLIEIDVTNLSKLKKLDCSSNQLCELNTNSNPELSELNCEDNFIQIIDFSKNLKLQKLLHDKNNLLNIIGENSFLSSKNLQIQKKNIEEYLFNFKINHNQLYDFESEMNFVEELKVYIGKYEVSNAEYTAFLKDYYNQNYINSTIPSIKFNPYNLNNQLIPDVSGFLKYKNTRSISQISNYGEVYHFNKDFYGYPICNINYFAAQEYCNWMTKKYGKGKFKFRLPTYNEFLYFSKQNNSTIAGGWENEFDKEGKSHFNHKSKILFPNYETSIYYNINKRYFIKNERDIKLPKNSYPVSHIVNNIIYFSVLGEERFEYVKLAENLKFIDLKTNQLYYENLNLQEVTNEYIDGFVYHSPSKSIYEEGENNKTNLYFKKNKSAYKPDIYGYFNVAGNVSEWVNTDDSQTNNKARVMGGNWDSYFNECNYNSYIEVDKKYISPLIGFRIVAEPIK